MSNQNNFASQMIAGVMSDLAEANSATAKEGHFAFDKADAVELLAGEISILDAGGRKQLAEAIYDLCKDAQHDGA
jgi:hypothetical protein